MQPREPSGHSKLKDFGDEDVIQFPSLITNFYICDQYEQEDNVREFMIDFEGEVYNESY